MNADKRKTAGDSAIHTNYGLLILAVGDPGYQTVYDSIEN